MTIELSLLNVQGAIHEGFWHEYGAMIAGGVSAFAAIVSAIAVLRQCKIINSQKEIMKRQTEISDQANKISKKVAFLPVQEKVLLEWLTAENGIQSFLGSLTPLLFPIDNPKERSTILEIINNLKKRQSQFFYLEKPNFFEATETASLFFKGNLCEEFDKWAANGEEGKILYHFLTFTNLDHLEQDPKKSEEANDIFKKSKQIREKLLNSQNKITDGFKKI